MWWLLACVPVPDPGPARWPTPGDDAAALRITGARTYLDAPRPPLAVLSDAGTAARSGDPAARALLSDWLLDAEVRRATRGERALTDVLEAAPDGVDGDGWRAAAQQVAGPLPAWAAQDAADGVLDYGVALHWFGVAWDDADPDHRALVPDPGAMPQAVARRHRW